MPSPKLRGKHWESYQVNNRAMVYRKVLAEGYTSVMKDGTLFGVRAAELTPLYSHGDSSCESGLVCHDKSRIPGQKQPSKEQWVE
jgi:hypothetical protein